MTAEADIAALCRDEIAAIVQRQEGYRQGAHREAKQLRAAMIAGGVGCGVLGLLIATGPVGYGITGGLAIGLPIAGQVRFRKARDEWHGGLGGEIFPVICRHIGDLEYGRQQIYASHFADLGVVPGHATAKLEDPVNGTWRDLRFEMTEARLESGGENNSRVFEGLLMRIGLAATAPDLFITRNLGVAGNLVSEVFEKGRGIGRRIDIGDAEFSRLFQAYAEDADAAHAYVTPRLIKGLVTVTSAYSSAQAIRAAFSGRYLYLAIPRRGDYLTIGELDEPLAIPDYAVRRIVRDLTMPRRIIDAFRGN